MKMDNNTVLQHVLFLLNVPLEKCLPASKAESILATKIAGKNVCLHH